MPALAERPSALPKPVRSRPARAAARILAAAQRMASTARQRRRLGQLPEHLLRDIGIPPDEARREARRLFWDVPDHWRR